MLPIAALIVADTTGRTFAGMDLNERAALVASDAVSYTHLTLPTILRV